MFLGESLRQLKWRYQLKIVWKLLVVIICICGFKKLFCPKLLLKIMWAVNCIFYVSEAQWSTTFSDPEIPRRSINLQLANCYVVWEKKNLNGDHAFSINAIYNFWIWIDLLFLIFASSFEYVKAMHVSCFCFHFNKLTNIRIYYRQYYAYIACMFK